MTTSTRGRSRPRAATSVASRIDGEEGVDNDDENDARVRVRASGGICPWREYIVASGGRRDASIWH
jgi:hypothetical protein